MNAALEQRVRDAVNEVLDPCSIGRGVAAGVVDMGMLCGLELLPGEHHQRVRVRVTLRLTSPACTFMLYFDNELCARLTALEEVEGVDVVWSERFDWSDEDMSDELKQRIRRKRELVLAQAAEASSTN